MRAVASFPSVQSIHPKRLLISIISVHPNTLFATQDLPDPQNGGGPYCKTYNSVHGKSMEIPSLVLISATYIFRPDSFLTQCLETGLTECAQTAFNAKVLLDSPPL